MHHFYRYSKNNHQPRRTKDQSGCDYFLNDLKSKIPKFFYM